jgi:hypothetical protein
MAEANPDHRSEHPTFPPFALFVFLVSLRKEIGARSGAVTRTKRQVRKQTSHFAAIAAEDAIGAECDREWDNLIAHFETELRRKSRAAAHE